MDVSKNRFCFLYSYSRWEIVSSIGAAPLGADPPLLTTCHNEKDILSELEKMRGLGGCHIGVIWADSFYTHTHIYIYIYPVGSMYGIFYLHLFFFMVNDGKYSIHGSYGCIYLYTIPWSASILV